LLIAADRNRLLETAVELDALAAELEAHGRGEEPETGPVSRT